MVFILSHSVCAGLVHVAEIVRQVAQPHDFPRELERALAAFGKVLRHDDLHVEVREPLLQQVDLGLGVLAAVIDRDDAVEAVRVADVVDVSLEVDDALLERGEVLPCRRPSRPRRRDT